VTHDDGFYEGEHLELVAFAYGQSRSGKTIYYSPVILRDDLEAPRPELRMVQSWLFWLNRPHSAHRARVHPLHNVRWDLMGPDTHRLMLAAVARVQSKQETKA
jgi:hypothetical protein